MRQRSWTSAEARVVREHYERGGSGAVQRELPDRSAQSIRDMAKRLGIKASRYKSNRGFEDYRDVPKYLA